MKKYLFGIVFGLLLAFFTVYVVLDTLVIARVYEQPEVTEEYDHSLFVRATETEKNETETQTPTPTNTETPTPTNSESETPTPTQTTINSDPVITENSYTDENIAITITEQRYKNTTVYVADIRLSSVEYLKTALARDKYGKNLKDETSDIAEAHGAILAINGDFYGARERGFVLRNGVLYRQTSSRGRECLIIYPDGSFEIATETTLSASALKNNNAWQVFSFGPGLVDDGKIAVGVNDEVGQAMASNPRTAIGMIDELHYVFVVSDGRIAESEGLSLYELAQFMQSLGVQTAYNLDGGGSSTMYFNGKIINTTTDSSKSGERSVSDIVYIGY